MTGDTKGKASEEINNRVRDHLEKALEVSEEEDMEYHIREALSLLHL